MNNSEKQAQMLKNANEILEVGGLNCAETVFLSYLKIGDSGFDESAVCLVSGFGGGFSKKQVNTCGALLGACLAVGCTRGRKNPLDKSSQKIMSEVGGIYKSLSEDFSKEFSSTICCEMCSKFDNKKEVMQNCKSAMLYAVKKAGEIIYPVK